MCIAHVRAGTKLVALTPIRMYVYGCTVQFSTQYMLLAVVRSAECGHTGEDARAFT